MENLFFCRKHTCIRNCINPTIIISLCTVFAKLAVIFLKRSSVRPYVCPSVLRLSICLLSRRSTAAATCGGFAAEFGRGQERSVNSFQRRVPAINRHPSSSCRFAAAARHAGRVNFGPTVRRSNTYFLFLFSIPCYSLNWPASFRPRVKTGCRIVSQFVSYHNRLFCAMRRQPLLLNTYSLWP